MAPERANNFDTLRFVAAMAVLWSHTFSAAMGYGAWEPLKALSGGQTTLGTIAVAVFFIISGYLITQSFEHSRSVWRFVKARILRLMPALLVVLLLAALIMGPIVTVLPLAEYFESWGLYRYVGLNGSLLGYAGRLPGVFIDNPGASVNGPLWTLRFEAYCYVLIFALGVVGLLSRFVTLALYAGGLAFLVFDGPYIMEDFQEWDHHVDLATKFLAGAVLYHWRPRLSGTTAGVCLAATLLTLVTEGFWLVLPTAFAYAVIYVAFAPAHLPNLARFGDLSYGVYIYGWPVKQLIVHYGLAEAWYEIGLLATPLTLVAAFLSWHLIEKVALSFKDRRLPGEAQLAAWINDAASGLQRAMTLHRPRGG